MPVKNSIVEAADSMREGWEAYKSDLNSYRTHPMPGWEVEQKAVAFVSQLMPGQDATTVLAVAKRLKTG